jgi:hypothetical protein
MPNPNSATSLDGIRIDVGSALWIMVGGVGCGKVAMTNFVVDLKVLTGFSSRV